MNAQKKKSYWNNGVICKKLFECPEGWIRGRIPYKRTVKPEHGEKISAALKGKTPWNKGRKGVSEETSKKMSGSAKDRVARGIIPNNTGKTPWNKGLTSDVHPSIARGTEKQKGQIRNGNYTTGKEHPNFNPNRKAFLRYRQEVNVLSENIYRRYKDEINPYDYPRGKAGINGAYHLDHIVSIHYGFTNDMKPDIIAHKDNLQMLYWKENIIKSNN
jgi:hypothetical protein